MKNVVLEEVKKIRDKYNKKEKIIIKMLEICQGLGYNFCDTINMINDFYSK